MDKFFDGVEREAGRVLREPRREAVVGVAALVLACLKARSEDKARGRF